MVPLIILYCVLTVTLAGKHDIYSGFSVYGVPLRDRSDQITLDGLETDMDIDIWNHGVPGGRDAYVMVSPEKRNAFLDILEKHGLKHYVHLANILGALKMFDVALSHSETRSNILRDFPFQTFHPSYAQVDAYMERLAREYPNLISLVVAGRSFEGRPVKYLKISSSNFMNATKPVYFMGATMHATEWVAPSLAVYTMHRLVEGLRDEDRDVLENTDWIILPIANPDGYEYSKNNERVRRRSRSFNSSVSLTCRGVDINPNFDVNFNTTTFNKNNGDNNSGIDNNGNNNSGNYNNGNNNSGNNNVGNGNTGNNNRGDNNSGNDNIGNNNSGTNNVGNYNSGNYNIGNNNSGNYNIGNNKSGNNNIGKKNIHYNN